MDTRSSKTKFVRKEDVENNWLLIDAANQPLGRLSTRIATWLQGKHKASYTPHVTCGDHVVVINAAKIRMTGKKWEGRKYFTYTGYPGGRKTPSPKEIFSRNPSRLIEWAVRGMLPKNRIGLELFRRLHVYREDSHPHEAQKPRTIELDTKVNSKTK